MSEAHAPQDTPSARGDQGTCLITGATGFIGGRLAARLARERRPVRCLVRAGSDSRRLDELDLELVVGDLNQPHTLARAVQGCTGVLHCAALVSDWATRQEIVRANVEGTRNLLHACAQSSVERFVHFSSTDVYGHPGGANVQETHVPTRFRNWYAQTKLQAEAQVRHAQQAHGLRAVILRPATVYGPGSRDVIGEIARAIVNRNMLLVAKGRAVAGLCYVENLIDAALLALANGAAAGHAFNVTDGVSVTWRRFTDDLADGLGCPRPRWSVPYWLASAIGVTLEGGYRLLRRGTGLSAAPLLSRQAVQVLGENQDFSNTKARGLLGWEPRVSYAAGLEATLAWLRADYLAPASPVGPA